MSENERLARIESKLDRVLEEHGNRITKLETQAGFFQWTIALLITSIIAVLTKILGK